MEKKTIEINLNKVLLYGALALVFIYGLFLYVKSISEQLTIEEEVESDFALTCEGGETIRLADSEKPLERFSGKLQTTDGLIVSIEGVPQKFKPSDHFSLAFFSGRKVEMLAEKDDAGEMVVREIKCIGEEANPEIIAGRNQVMSVAVEKLNELAPEKPKKYAWTVERFYFVDNENFYIQYVSENEEDDEYYEDKLLLLRVKQGGSELDFEQLAYINMGDEGEEIKVLSGEDIYKDRKDLSLYEYNEDTGKWALSE